MCEYPSHPRTQADRGRAWRSTIATLASATHPFHSLLLIFFSTVGKAPPDSPADRRLAYPSSANPIEELAPLVMGGPRTSFDVFLKQQHGVLIQLWMFAQPLLRGQRATLGEP